MLLNIKQDLDTKYFFFYFCVISLSRSYAVLVVFLALL